jgi:hypothetical protein
VALIDLDHEYPLKLKSSFPSAVTLYEYQDLLQLAGNIDSRYQKNFYFTETSQISFFPAHKLKDPGLLFSDTTLRDFLIQVKANFDLVLINLPAGVDFCQKVSGLLTRSYLWRGNRPVSILVSQADERSLVALDQLIHEHPAFSYQLQENTLLFFNRVPCTPEEQKLADITLNGAELRRLFSFPLVYIAGINEELPVQRLNPAPTVLDTGSLLHQTISSLHRVLARLGDSPTREIAEKGSDFQPVLDGELLEKLAPYLEKIQLRSAARLFLHPAQIQVFLEENSGSFRIRIRTTGLYQPLLGIRSSIEQTTGKVCITRPSPESFVFSSNKAQEKNCQALEKNRIPDLSVTPIFRFDDRFAWKTSFIIHTNDNLVPRRSRYPSPILFKPANELPEIPSLAHILGYARRKYKPLDFPESDLLTAVPGVTHFFIPPEFDISYSNRCLFKTDFVALFSKPCRTKIEHFPAFVPAYQLNAQIETAGMDIPDIFARNKPFMAENDFAPRLPREKKADFSYLSRFVQRFGNNIPALNPQPFYQCSTGRLPATTITSPIIPDSLATAEISASSIDNLCYYIMEKRLFEPVSPSFHIYPFSSSGINYKPKITTVARMVRQTDSMSPTFIGSSIGLIEAPGFVLHDLRHYPGMHSLSHSSQINQWSAPVMQEREGKKLPVRMTKEAVLLEHVFAGNTPIESRPGGCYYQNIRFPEFKTDFNLFFWQEQVNRASETMPTTLGVPAAMVKQVFMVKNSGFKPFIHLFSGEIKKPSKDIFPVSLLPGRDSKYRDYSGTGVYRTDSVVDNNFGRRDLSLTRKRMLEPRILRKQANFGNQKTVFRTVCPEVKMTITQATYFHPGSAVPPRHINVFKNMAKPALINTTAPQKILAANQEWPAESSMKTRFPPSFYQTEYCLTTLPVRTGQKKFFGFTGSNSIPINSFKALSIGQILAFEDPIVRNPNINIGFADLQIPSAVPMRSKRPDIPGIEVTSLRDIGSIIADKVLQIRSIPSGIFAFQTSRLRNSRFSGSNITPSENKLQEKCCEDFVLHSPSRISWPHHFANTCDEYFALLLRNIRIERQKPVLHTFRTKPAMRHNHDFHATALSAQTFAKTGFSEKRAVATNRMSQQERQPFVISGKIAALKLRDLMNLAKQATQRFSEISNKIVP